MNIIIDKEKMIKQWEGYTSFPEDQIALTEVKMDNIDTIRGMEGMYVNLTDGMTIKEGDFVVVDFDLVSVTYEVNCTYTRENYGIILRPFKQMVYDLLGVKI
jgi:hypothetical protein